MIIAAATGALGEASTTGPWRRARFVGAGRSRRRKPRIAFRADYGMGEGTIARIDAGECMRNMTEARAKELEGLGHQ